MWYVPWGSGVGGDVLYVHSQSLRLSLQGAGTRVRCVDGGGGGRLCVSVHVDACACMCARVHTGGCPVCGGMGLARVPVSCVTGSGVLCDPNT